MKECPLSYATKKKISLFLTSIVSELSTSKVIVFHQREVFFKNTKYSDSKSDSFHS